MSTGTALLRITQALDPLFPVGAFTLSNGLETYVQKELIFDEVSLKKYLTAYIGTLPTGDLGFAARAAMGDNITMLDELCAAAKSPYELRDGSIKLCRRFIKAQAVLNECPRLTEYSKKIADGECTGLHSIAVGLFIADCGADINEGLSLYCYSLLSAAVNHAVKLVPLRQLDGQRALGAMLEEIPSAVSAALKISPDELGISGAGFELRSMQHEKLFTRIYIS